MESTCITSELELETLREGDRGNAVIRLQQRLRSLSFYHAEITGEFDAITKRSLSLFQRHSGLSESGFMGPETWYALTFWSNETASPLSGFKPAFGQWLKKAKGIVTALGSHSSEPLLGKSSVGAREVQTHYQHYWPFAGRSLSD